MPSAATSETSASEKVTLPPPMRPIARIAAAAASAQRGEGVPRPSVQSALPSSPAATAACRIAARASTLSAAQASNRATPSSTRKRSVKGVMTGRGAAMSSASATPAGAARDSAASIRRLSSRLSAIAVTATRSAAIETLERGRAPKALSAKVTALSQPSGRG